METCTHERCGAFADSARQATPAAAQNAVADFFNEQGAAHEVDNRPRRPRKIEVKHGTLLEENPSFSHPAYDVVTYCAEERPFESVVALIEGNRYPKTFVARPEAFATLLSERGFLTLRTYVDGAAYEGTPEDLAKDESVDEEADIAYTLQATDEGLAAVSGLAPAAQLRSLFEEDPDAAPVHVRVLELCAREGGMEKRALEEALEKEGLIPHDERTGLVSIFPTYYIGNLERAGGLSWDGVWSTTPEGRALLEA